MIMLTMYNILTYVIYELTLKQDAQLSQKDRATGFVIVFAKSRRLELGDSPPPPPTILLLRKLG